MTKMLGKKSKYLENLKGFLGEISFFHHFSEVLVAKNCLRLESATLSQSQVTVKAY